MLCSKKILSFPSGFTLGVIAPLNSEKLDGFLSGPSFRLLQYFYWMFPICEVWLHVDVFMGYLLFWVAYALPQLRDVEHVVDIG